MSESTETGHASEEGGSRRDFLGMLTMATAAVGAASFAWPIIDSMNPSAEVLALASTEVDLSAMEVGQSITIIWRKKPVFIRRRTPEEIAEAEAVPMPRLRLTYMGYVLTFSVKKSSQWPTEHGVFLSVERIQKCAPMVFQLGVGQGLDFDVCGPYRPEDCCSMARRIVKSLILSFFHRKHCRFKRKEEMNVDYCLDLSNDHNWDLHSNARMHVAPFVNFVVSKDDITPTVYAKLDVEGSLHYFLGHKDPTDGPFEFPADGTEREIFVDLDEDNKDEVSFVSIAEQNTNMVCQNSDYLITTLPCKFL